MKETSGEFANHIERVESALDEYITAKEAHDGWLADWRRRNGIVMEERLDDAGALV